MNESRAGSPNAEAIEAWDTVLFDKFLRFRDLAVGGLGPHGDVAMERHPPREGARVLDVGCGFGDSTATLARRVGPEGHALGVDAAPRFIAAAREEASAPNVSFEVRDVQEDDLGGPFDYVFSRFGVMFFANPVAALRNIRGAMKPGGTLCFVVWRKREDNAFLNVAEKIVERIVGHHKKEEAVTCGPGPFSMSGADLVSDQMTKAGFSRISFERNDMPIVIGRDPKDAIAFALALGPAGEMMRLAGEDGEAKRPEVEAALEEAFRGLMTDRGVFGGSSTWILRAEAR